MTDDDVKKVKDLVEELKKSKKPAEEGDEASKKENDEADKAENDSANPKRRPGALDLTLLMKVKDTVLVPSTDTSD